MSAEDEEMYWGHPFKAQRHHIFKGGKSLCGSWMMTGHREEDAVEPSDEYTEGEDCKACAKQAEIVPFADAFALFDSAMDAERTSEYETAGRYVAEYERGTGGRILSVWEMPDAEPSDERWEKVAQVTYESQQECREAAASLESVEDFEDFVALHPHD